MKKIFILCSVIVFVSAHAMNQNDSSWCNLPIYQSLLTCTIFRDIKNKRYTNYERDLIEHLLRAADTLSGSGKSFSVWGSSYTPATPYYTPLKHRYMALEIFNFVINSQEEYKEDKYKKWAVVGHFYVCANICQEEQEGREEILKRMNINFLLN